MDRLFCCVQVKQSTIGIKERFGKFEEVLEPGCHCLPWFLGRRLAGILSLRLQKMEVKCETKTKVFIMFLSVILIDLQVHEYMNNCYVRCLVFCHEIDTIYQSPLEGYICKI